ncbi:MAG: hypothetical protein PHI53_03660 [Candidatus Pacebacteria bacterium]|nr:hypothetical protein [Candidatus Paceibacterota bacterium]
MDFDDENSCFVPAPVRPIAGPNPLSVLAITRPDDVVSLCREKFSLAREELAIRRETIRAIERVEVVKVYRDLGLGHCSVAISWIKNRREGEKHIRIATRGGLNLTTTVDIW